MSTNINDKHRIKCVNKINEYMKDERLSRNIEKGIYNYMISYSKENNITRKWENPIFFNLYFFIIYIDNSIFRELYNYR